MLLNAWATNLADFVMLKAKVPLQRRSVFVYGCELMLSTCASIISIIVISILVRAPYSSITFLFVFMGIRFFSRFWASSAKILPPSGCFRGRPGRRLSPILSYNARQVLVFPFLLNIPYGFLTAAGNP